MRGVRIPVEAKPAPGTKDGRSDLTEDLVVSCVQGLLRLYLLPFLLVAWLVVKVAAGVWATYLALESLVRKAPSRNHRVPVQSEENVERQSAS
jgi:hypothetical protein